MSKTKFKRLKNPSSWRRLSLATWSAPTSPTVYGRLELDFTKAKEYLKRVNETSTYKVSATHFVAKVVALALKKFPDLNGVIKWHQIYLRESVDIFLQVAIEDDGAGNKADLSGAKVDNCDQISIQDIAGELFKKAQKIRSNKDPQFKKSKTFSKLLPPFLLGYFLKLMSFLMYNLNLNLPSLGLVHDAFGSAMVTSVGMWKVPPGYAPLVPFSRVPMIVCVGQVNDKPWVENKEIKIKPIIDVTVTFDHRFIDGLTGAKMANFVKDVFEDPEKYLE